MDVLDESSEPSTCTHTLRHVYQTHSNSASSARLHGSSSHPWFPALRPQAAVLLLTQEGSTWTSPLAPAYLTSASGRKEASRLAPTLAARVPLHLLHLYLPISAHGDTTHPAVTPWRALGPCPSRPTADPRTTVLALVLKTTGLPWWLGVNNPPSSAGGTGPTPLGNTRGPGASKPTGPSTEPRGPLPWQLQERLCSKKTRHSQNK